MIDTAASIRPTRNRLLAAMGVSVCIIALLLVSVGLLVNLAVSVSRIGGENSEVLTVRINKDTGKRAPDSTTDDDADVPSAPHEQQVASAERSATQPEVAPEDLSESPGESRPTKDWYAIVDQVAKTTVDDYFRQKESRAALWRRSPSVMFEPGEELVLKGEEPVIANFRFVPEIHVLGLGITIGSCFFGVPIAGVPVEQRNAAITLFVCAEGS